MGSGSDFPVGVNVDFGELCEVVDMAGFDNKGGDLKVTRAIDRPLLRLRSGRSIMAPAS